MVKRSPPGSAPSNTIGAEPLRTIPFQLAPPSVDRSIMPGVLQSPTVARHAVVEDVANSRRSAGAGSTGRTEGVESAEVPRPALFCPLDVEGEDVAPGDDVTVGKPPSLEPWSAGCAVKTRSGRNSKNSSTTFTTMSAARIPLGSTLIPRRIR
jgi:hypothetical protein